MSANYPGCTYIGVNSISSDEDGKPFDVEFIKSDIRNEGLPYDDNRFDFIVIRFCAWEYSESEWKDIIKELIRCLKPGGWVEVCYKNNEFFFFINMFLFLKEEKFFLNSYSLN